MDETNASKGKPLKEFFKNKKLLYYIIAIVAMAAISLAYFYPDAMEGNVLRQHDMMQGAAVGHEAQVFKEQTGETTRWTNSLFSGMPTFQISPSYGSSALLSWIGDVYGLWLPSPANLLFMMMAGFFILLMACRVKWYTALIGAIAYGFSSYFIILIGAGHIWKFVTLTYVPPTIAGIIWCYRGRYLAGGAVAALFAAMQIASNHPQMSYYFLFLIAALAIGYLVEAKREAKMKQWCIATGTLLVAAILAVLANSPNLYNTYQYSKETIRGGHSEIAAQSENATKGGLDKDYITAWSYGISETFTLMVPNVDGGATIKPEKGSNIMLSLAETPKAQEMLQKGEISPQDYQYLSQFPQYFGDQPMTNGPVYAGALTVALFIIGCIVIKGPVKWAMLIATIITVMLSWGHNMMWFTDLFIDYFPMYNKFRTVSSILVVAELTIPLLAMLALNKILTEKDFLRNHAKTVFITMGACAIVCLLIYLFPGMFNLFSQSEKEGLLNQGLAQQLPTLFAAVEKVRASMISADAMRSFIIIILGMGILFVMLTGKIKAATAAILTGIVILLDLYTVNKRYLDTDSFTKPVPAGQQQFAMRPADQAILQDTTQNYRVYDIQNFAEAMPSYYHKAIGGYHAAKLSRYQDLIDYQISQGNMAVLNMLNTRYFIASDTTVQFNRGALGNAWFVNSLKYVDTPVEEMQFLDNFNPATQAVADKKFEQALGSADLAEKAQGDTIFETTYAPNRLTYHANTANGGLAVFSEIYFPWGWTATIDGQEAEIGRVNYVLRALRIPAGSHTIEFAFEPKSVTVTETLAYISIIIIYLAVIAAIAKSAYTAVATKKR